MSECVVRMEMPEKCGKCPLAWYDGAGPCFCMVSLERNDAVDDGMMWKEAEPNKKPQWCPILCQLPEGHGRLVDADAVESIIRKWFEYIKLNPDILLDGVKSLHTIVPAEAERGKHEAD